MEEYLLIQYHKGLLSQADQEEVESWLEEKPEHRESYRQSIQIWLHAENASHLNNLNVEADLEAVHARMGTLPSSRGGFAMRYWRIAALLLVGLGLSWGIWQFTRSDSPAPLLTLETGDTPGKTFALADGSQVRLNANSKLDYPDRFDGSKRTVHLTGEAWFKVQADKDHPFVIQHGASRTEVLGTEFDIRAYQSESTVRVAVSEGTVRLSAEKTSASKVILTKGEVGEFTQGNALKSKVKAQDLNLDSWRTGNLTFERTPFLTVVEALERHYGIQITLKKSPTADKCLYTGSLEKLPVEEAIELVSLAFNAEFTIKGSEITILRVNC